MGLQKVLTFMNLFLVYIKLKHSARGTILKILTKSPLFLFKSSEKCENDFKKLNFWERPGSLVVKIMNAAARFSIIRLEFDYFMGDKCCYFILNDTVGFQSYFPFLKNPSHTQ